MCAEPKHSRKHCIIRLLKPFYCSEVGGGLRILYACAFGKGRRSNKHNQQLGPATRTIFHRGHAAVVFYGGLSPEKAISLSKYKFNWKGRGIITMKGSFWGDYFYYLESPNFFPSAPHLFLQDNIYPIRRIFSLIKRDHNSAAVLLVLVCVFVVPSHDSSDIYFIVHAPVERKCCSVSSFWSPHASPNWVGKYEMAIGLSSWWMWS